MLCWYYPVGKKVKYVYLFTEKTLFFLLTIVEKLDKLDCNKIKNFNSSKDIKRVKI